MSLPASLRTELDDRVARGRLDSLVVHFNDTYQIAERRTTTGVTTVPGLARVATLIDELHAWWPSELGPARIVPVHAGDYLSPSLLGKRTRGRHLVDCLAALGLRWMTIGNHEFDYEGVDPGALQRELARVDWRPICCNLEHATIPTWSYGTWPAARPWLAVTGVAGRQTMRCARDVGWQASEIESSVAEVVARICQEQVSADTLLVLSHMGGAEDEALALQLETAWTRGPVFVLGGHQHHVDLVARVGERCVLAKNLANMRSVKLLALAAPEPRGQDRSGVAGETVGHGQAGCEGAGPTSRRPRNPEEDVINVDLETLVALPQQAKMEARVQTWISADVRAEERRVVADFSAQTAAFEARDAEIRRRSTDLGNLAADCVRAHFDADLVLIQAGRFRLDDLLDPQLTLRLLRETLLFDDPGVRTMLCLDLPTSLCAKLIEHGARRPGHGSFPQLAWASNVQLDWHEDRVTGGESSTASDTAGGTTAVGLSIRAPRETLRMAFVGFALIDGQDGYRRILLEHDPDVAALDARLASALESGASLIDVIAERAAGTAYDDRPRVPSEKTANPVE